MTDLQKTYKEVIVAVDGRKGMTFEKIKKEEKHQLGNAGIAIAVSVLNNGDIKINHLTKQIPDFTQTELRTALTNLRKNGYFVFDKKDKRYRVALGDNEQQSTDIVVWALLGAVASGWIERK